MFSSDIFIGLNVVRTLSIISLLLLFASSIVTMVHDVQAVNAFISAGKADPNIRFASNTTTNSTDFDCVNGDTDYVEYVMAPSSIHPEPSPLLILVPKSEAALFRTSPLEPSGLCLTGSSSSSKSSSSSCLRSAGPQPSSTASSPSSATILGWARSA